MGRSLVVLRESRWLARWTARPGRIRCLRVAGAWLLLLMAVLAVVPAAAEAARPSARSVLVPALGAHGGVVPGGGCAFERVCLPLGGRPGGTERLVPSARPSPAFGGSPADPWAIQPTPNPAVVPSALFGVSCTSTLLTKACTAVGASENSAGTEVALAERWDGTSWVIQPTPVPAGATFSALVGVSCTSASACTAVGAYTNSAGTRVTLAERWDGTSWTIQPTPNVPGASDSFLEGVSCTSASACTAVGRYSIVAGTVVTLAERWDGTSWVIQPTPNPAGSTFSELLGVSCTSASACTAVGLYINSAGTVVTLAERLSGLVWAIQATPKPAGATGSELLGVSCTSMFLTKACTAVGAYTNSAGTTVTLAERWNGTSWVIQPTPNPAGATLSVLGAVSCTSASACTAAGAYITSAGTTVMLAERWNGTSWVIQPTPAPAGATGSALYGVSCTSASACTAVGAFLDSGGDVVTLAERWDGTSWAIQSTPNPAAADSSQLNGVSCTSASACTAVGHYINSAGTRVTLAEAWDGTSWNVQPTPNPAGATRSELNGVSCTSASACTAVGDYTNSAGTEMTLAEAWDGTSWTIQPTPSTGGQGNGGLNAVSCTSADACTAVGGPFGTLVERWDGTSWAIQPTPASAFPGELNGVSCTSASACTAVGNTYGGCPPLSGPCLLAEAWDGTSWTIQPTPVPTGAQFSEFDGVSCTSASACTAVGRYENSQGYQITLVEAWDGTSWTIQPTPAGGIGLFGVSCTSASACTAVGDNDNSAGTTVTLAEAWDGTSWTIQPTPNPASATFSELFGVSCTSASACTAVGFYSGGALVERHS